MFSECFRWILKNIIKIRKFQNILPQHDSTKLAII
jgi:hypothetical protein